MAVTRGTASQTLKSLVRKNMIKAQRSASDGRSVLYRLTEASLQALQRPTVLE
jgi:DNA-binding MarR family transcriptional regulator